MLKNTYFALLQFNEWFDFRKNRIDVEIKGKSGLIILGVQIQKDKEEIKQFLESVIPSDDSLKQKAFKDQQEIDLAPSQPPFKEELEPK